jgi:hypothetical protein
MLIVVGVKETRNLFHPTATPPQRYTTEGVFLDHGITCERCVQRRQSESVGSAGGWSLERSRK